LAETHYLTTGEQKDQSYRYECKLDAIIESESVKSDLKVKKKTQQRDTQILEFIKMLTLSDDFSNFYFT
jgi:hypothetical protein